MIENLERVLPQISKNEKVKTGKTSSLLDHIQHFKKNFSQEGLPYDWYDLPGTGFMVNKQVSLIFSDLKPQDSQSILKEKKEKALNQTDQDIKGFILEYLAQGLVFPIHYHIDSNGQLIDKNYGNKRVIDTVSEEERGGSVKKTLEKDIEPFLVNASDGSIAVMVSPSGWSGLRQENGREITYPDSQTYIWQKKGQEVFGFTIRTDFSNTEHQEVLRRLGKILPPDVSVIDFVKNPALVDAKENPEIKDIKDVVNIMQLSRHHISSDSLFAYKDRLWEEAYGDLERRDELYRYDDFTSEITRDFRNFILNNNLNKQQTKEALAVTILRIAKFLGEDSLRPKNEKVIFETSKNSNLYVTPRSQFSYGKILEEVQKLPGCAGGGGKNGTSLVKSITTRFGNSESSGPCCDKNTADNHYHCPDCNKEYSDETNKSPEERTKQCSCGFKFGC